MSGEQGYGADAADGSQQQQQQKQNVTIAKFTDEAIEKFIKAYAEHKKVEQQQNATIAKFTDEAIEKFIKAYAEHKEVEQHQGDLHGYLMVLATLTASITYTAALTPPGGFWGGDDKGQIPGTPILRHTFPCRYLTFYHCNAVSFASSLCIIVILANRKLFGLFKQTLFTLLVSDAMGLIGAFAAGSSTEVQTTIFTMVILLIPLTTQCITLLRQISSRRLR